MFKRLQVVVFTFYARVEEFVRKIHFVYFDMRDVV